MSPGMVTEGSAVSHTESLRQSRMAHDTRTSSLLSQYARTESDFNRSPHLADVQLSKPGLSLTHRLLDRRDADSDVSTRRAALSSMFSSPKSRTPQFYR